MTKPRWRNPDKRMIRAVELRAQGWSLRRIGTELAVGEATIRRDLARYSQKQEASAPTRPQLRVVRHLAAPSAPNDASKWRSNDAVEEGG